jgi:regulator of CtrA degradation
MSKTARCVVEDERDNAVSFGAHFARTSAFNFLFSEATHLVDRTAGYLDGQGRADSADLRGSAALAFAQESTRLSTRLMRLMSWLLIRRALVEGDMTEEEADAQRRKSESFAEPLPEPETLDILPQALTDLIAEAARLELRTLHIDASELADAPRPSPVRRDLTLLKAAFGGQSGPAARDR